MSTVLPTFATWLSAQACRIEQMLSREMPSADTVPKRLHDAMRYAVLGGGKRVRAALVYAAGESCAGIVRGESADSLSNFERALDCAAAAVELVHAYSLVHDDLPCMDDDHLRRGQPTVHIRYDEATALLAGDALQPSGLRFLGSDADPVPADCDRDPGARASVGQPWNGGWSGDRFGQRWYQLVSGGAAAYAPTQNGCVC